MAIIAKGMDNLDILGQYFFLKWPIRYNDHLRRPITGLPFRIIGAFHHLVVSLVPNRSVGVLNVDVVFLEYFFVFLLGPGRLVNPKNIIAGPVQTMFRHHC